MKVDLTPEEFLEVRTLLDKTAGLVFDESRRDSLCYSIGERMSACGIGRVVDYVAFLRTSEGADEMQSLLNAVTIQETHFFRNPPQFRALRQHVLPALVKKAATGDRRLRIWSAGCSTGEEPYSIAMLIRELVPLLDGWDIGVVGTDISTRALDAARAGRYTSRSMGVADPTDVARWFLRDGTDYVVRPEVREIVQFRRHNLVTDPPPFDNEPIDLILCRNVTIYFSRDTTRKLMATLHNRLMDGGYLFLGHSETLWQINDQFRLVTLGDAFVYRRDGAGSAGVINAAGERRSVLPDRRTGDDGTPDGERRANKVERRSAAWELLTKPRTLPFPKIKDKVADAQDDGSAAPQVPAEPVDAILAIRSELKQGHYEQVVALAQSLAAAEPLRAEGHYLCGLALANLGRDSEALGHLRKAVYVDPTLGFAHFALAGALSRLGDTGGASASYRAAAESLGRNVDDKVAAELGGRDVAELVALCWQLSGTRRTAG
ncbi:MAG TPA: CheR family methyltransferase [Mycobacteriales bacterium]|nr:CheR family methyltransferase [Mycobacteriales bacterium]